MEMEKYFEDLKNIEDRIENEIDKNKKRKNIYIRYASYETTHKDGVERIIDNLDDVAIEGYVVFESKEEPFYGGPKTKSYRSKVLKNPTWMKVAVCAEQKIRKTRDFHHCFLESFKFLRNEEIKGKSVKVYDFSMGS